MRDWSNEIRSVLAVLKLEATCESQLVEELSQHFYDRGEAMLASGLTAQQVEEALMQELHDPALIAGLKATAHSEVASLPVGSDSDEQFLARLWMDLRYAARLLYSEPRLCTRRDSLACAWDWREYWHFSAAKRGAVARTPCFQP